ncbi:S8 family serine peptidase [Deinococcus sp. KNUC1210]|uniref:S8 family serine peptidase n=1 Tax=Deinococcus sp. KNUC1210 TaxID=2917691 RepID=UPI00351D792C
MTKAPTALLLLPLTASLLSACMSSPSATVAALAADHPGQVAPRYDYVAAVPLRADDTPASVQAAAGGQVLAWKTPGCAQGDCEALVGLNAPSGLAAQSLGQTVSTLSARLGRSVTLEENRDQFSAGSDITATIGGARVAWAGGSLLAWTGGARVAWAGGTYAPVPQNTATWTTLRLQDAQTRAPNLGAGVMVAVIDTGLDLTHPAFQDALSDPSTWQDFYAGDTVPQDEGTLGVGGYGHGTNVAGIVLQIAPLAKIMPIRVLGPDGSGDVVNIAKAIAWATANGADIINLSLGSTKDSSIVQDAIKYATSKNVLVIASAGNANSDKLTFPASLATNFPNLLSVGSVNATDVKSSFSNYGDKLELMAPGENVYAPAPGNLLAAWSGTSQAAPMAAGGLALALGQTLSVPIGGLIGKLEDTSFNLYTVPLNKPYAGKLGMDGSIWPPSWPRLSGNAWCLRHTHEPAARSRIRCTAGSAAGRGQTPAGRTVAAGGRGRAGLPGTGRPDGRAAGTGHQQVSAGSGADACVRTASGHRRGSVGGRAVRTAG